MNPVLDFKAYFREAHFNVFLDSVFALVFKVILT